MVDLSEIITAYNYDNDSNFVFNPEDGRVLMVEAGLLPSILLIACHNTFMCLYKPNN